MPKHQKNLTVDELLRRRRQTFKQLIVDWGIKSKDQFLSRLKEEQLDCTIEQIRIVENETKTADKVAPVVVQEVPKQEAKVVHGPTSLEDYRSSMDAAFGIAPELPVPEETTEVIDELAAEAQALDMYDAPKRGRKKKTDDS